MHPALCQQIRIRLAEDDPAIPPTLRLFWTVLLDHQPLDHNRFLWTSKQYQTAPSEPERLRIEEDVVHSLAPRLVVRPGPSLMLKLERLDRTTASTTSLDDCAHLEIVAGDEDARYQIRDILREPPLLARHAVLLTAHLEQALYLESIATDEGYSYFFRPTIAPNDMYPDSEFNAWSHLIDLVRDSYLALATVDRAGADNLLRRWVLSRRPMFRRLALHALTENPKSDIRLSRDLLLAGHKPGLWDVELHLEVLRFLRCTGARLPRGLRVEIVRAIHTGPRPMRKRTPPFTRRMKALRLSKLAQSGARLDKKSRLLVAKELESRSEQSEEVQIRHGEGTRISDNESPDAHYDSYRDVIAALRNQRIDSRRLGAVVLEQPLEAVAAIRRLAKRGELSLLLWESFLNSIADLRGASLPKLRRSSGRALALAPDEAFSGASWAAAEFIQHLADDHDAEEESEFAILWTRAWNTFGDSQSSDEDFDDPLTAALNHPAGKLARAALTRLSKHQPTPGSRLPSPVQGYFDAIAKDPNGGLGRVMLATSLLRLYAIDPKWTQEHLICRLDSSRSDEARSLWSAFAWSQTIGPNLLRAFKDAFLEILCGREGQKLQTRLTGLFMAICLEAPDELSVEEVHKVVGKMSEEALQRVLLNLKGRMKGASDQRGRVWTERLHPWLEQYWPRVLAQNTPATSTAMLDMLVEAGDAIPDAIDWALPYLRPLEGHGLHRLGQEDLPERYPGQVLRLLGAVVTDGVLPPHQKYALGELLDRLKAARPELSEDTRFQQLYRLASG